jgi:hypothetical protein
MIKNLQNLNPIPSSLAKEKIFYSFLSEIYLNAIKAKPMVNSVLKIIAATVFCS